MKDLLSAIESVLFPPERRFRPTPSVSAHESLREAAVIMPLVERKHDWHVLLTERAGHLPRHAGEVAFPGGKIEKGDRSPLEAARRELEEELGLSPDRWVKRPLGQIAPLVAPKFRFFVHVFLCELEAGYKAVPDQTEVADAFEVPLTFLLNKNHWRRLPRPDAPANDTATTAIPARRFYWRIAYPDKMKERVIWGLTAQMIVNLAGLLEERV